VLVAGKARQRTPGPLDRPRGRRIKLARDAMKLTQSELADRMGVDVGTISRWERGFPMKPRDVAGLAVALSVSPYVIDPEAAKTLGENARRGQGDHSVEEDGASGRRFPMAALLRLPDVRARLNAIQAELIEGGATPEQEESVMRTIRDRQLLARFAGGSENDQYTEAELLQAIDNIAETARRFLAGPTL
jgi:transcriptional regulator with XRE-family HTH domain